MIGSYLHRYAYPDYWRMHVDDNGRELKNWVRGKTFDANLSGETHPFEEFVKCPRRHAGPRRLSATARRIHVRGRRQGRVHAYDVASIANKGTSERILKGPVLELSGHDTNVKTSNATCMALATNQPIAPTPQHAGKCAK